MCSTFDFNMASDVPTLRFEILNDGELGELLEEADSKNKKRQIKYAVSIFQDYCSTCNIGDIENMSDVDLDNLLARFYAGARNKAGEMYCKKTMQAIRYGLQRHFQTTRNVDIVKGTEFKGSNKIFKAFLAKLKKSGKGNVKQHPPVSPSDMEHIQESLDLNTAEGLQQSLH